MEKMNVCLLVIMVVFLYGATAANNSTAPPVQRYTVTDKGVDCILFEAGIRLHFNYTTSNEENVTLAVDVPAGNLTTSSGSCGNKTQTLRLSFSEEPAVLTFTFQKTGKNDKNEALTLVSFAYDGSLLPNSTANKTYIVNSGNITKYECPLGKGFLCDSNISIPFNHTTPLVRIETIKLRSEAFRTTNATKFNSDYTQCTEDNKISNIIPIAVGAALGALVLVVLIAYLVGRKRSQRGYETV